MNEIEDSTTRISHLVGAAKQYSQLDRAPVPGRRRARTARQHAADARPARSARGSRWSRTTTGRCPRSRPTPAELNQVWTNLIDNAVCRRWAGTGTLTVRTALDRRPACWSSSATPARASRRRSGPRSSSRSSPPSRSARAPGSAWTSPGGSSSTSTTATCTSSPSPGDTRFQVRLPLTADGHRTTAATGALDSPDDPTADRMTDEDGIDPTVPPSGDRLRRVRRGGRLVVPPAPVRAVRARRLLRLLAVPARHRARQGHRAPADPELRAGRGLVLELPGRASSTRRARAGAAAQPPARTRPRPARADRVPADWQAHLHY